MAKYQNLINSISSVIRTNGNNEITGQILQDVLKSIVNVVGANPTYGGVAHPADNPGTPDGGVVYIASEEGTYVNFGGLTLASNELAVLVWNGTSWSKESVTYIEDLGDIEAAKQEALDAIAEAIQGLNIYYTIETDKGTVKDVQLKDGQGNKLMPRTTTENVTTQKGDTPVSVIETIFDLNSKSMIQMDLTFMEQGTMTIKEDGTYWKGAATSGFVRLKKSAMHLGAKSVIKIKPGVQLYVGGMYDDGTPVVRIMWKLIAGGTYYVDKPGKFAIILRYPGSVPFDGETYTAEDLASHMTIIGNEVITETLDSINYLEDLSFISPRGITLNMNYLEIGGLQMANDGTATRYPNNNGRLSPISIYLHFQKGTIIRADAGAQMMFGGHMDDGTFFKPATFQISGPYGGAYHCAKSGYYYFVARYVGEPAINSDGYPQDGLASKIHIIPPTAKLPKTDYSIRCIAHQGMTNDESKSVYGNSRVSSYLNAGIAGFTHGEVDIRFTSDNIAVCCHEAYFTDSVTGERYTIAENTVEQLKSATYYGEKIATLDEVVAACKSVGLGLYIDKTYEINSDVKWDHVYSILKKYSFESKVTWLYFNQIIIDACPKSKFSIIPYTNTVEYVVNMLTTYNNQYPEAEFMANVDFNNFSIEDIQSINSQIPYGTSVEVYTIDNLSTYKQYLPYVSGITSNKFNEAMI